MATGVTLSTNGFIPDVWADLAQAEFLHQARVIQSATQADTLVGQPGDSIKFPKWTTLTDLDDLTENVAMVPEVLDQTVGEAKIKEVGKAVEFTDTRDLNTLGSVQSEAVRQFGILASRKIDADLIAAASAETAEDPKNKVRAQAPLKVSGTGAMSWKNIVAGLAAFGDDWDPSAFSALYIRSDMAAALMGDDQFINAQVNGTASSLRSGQIGTLAGLPVVVTDRLPSGQWMLLKPGALGVIYKRRPLVETDRDILKRTRVVTTTIHYAVKRLNDRGVLIGTLTA